MYSLSTVTYASKIGFLKSHVCLSSRYWIKISEWKSEWFLYEEERRIKYFLIQKVGLEQIIEDLGSSIHHPFELNLRRCYLTILPDNIGKLIHLTSLDIGENQLLSLPNSIGNLVNLKEFYIDDNKLDKIPDSIENLVNLNKLILYRNALMNIPSSILNLSKLQSLSVAQNQIEILPDNIDKISNLESLYLDNNKFSQLPKNIANLRNLTEITLSGNPLDDLSILRCLPQLESVYFFNYLYLPNRYWTKLSEYKPEWLLDEENAEIRRLLIQICGYERICQELDAIELDTWREYTLLKIDAEVDVELMVLLKMTCPSTAHIHILRVPPEMTSAESAITWVNHGIHPDEFAVQT
jgi:leucine-rich repeat protein SHOC2